MSQVRLKSKNINNLWLVEGTATPLETVGFCIMTTEQFIEKLSKTNTYYQNGYFSLIGKYTPGQKVSIQTPYGVCIVTPDNLYKNIKPSIGSAIDKDSFYRTFIHSKNEHYREGRFKIISEFKGFNQGILVETKYGIHKINANCLKRNEMPYISSSLDKLSFVRNILLDNSEDYKNGRYEVINYDKGKVFLKDKYGECRVALSELINNQNYTINASTNKNEYFINRAMEIHGNTYDYSLVNYISAHTKISINCDLHGIFTQSPDKHLQGRGCNLCGRIRIGESMVKNPNGWSYTNWQKSAESSLRFESYKVYILKCSDENEEFYKIGKTYCTLDYRFYCNKMPYLYEVVNTTEGDSRYISELETQLLNAHKAYQYIPLKLFNGRNECFSKIDFSLIPQST